MVLFKPWLSIQPVKQTKQKPRTANKWAEINKALRFWWLSQGVPHALVTPARPALLGPKREVYPKCLWNKPTLNFYMEVVQVTERISV